MPARRARSWWVTLLGLVALLLGMCGLGLAVVPCVTVASLYLTIPALVLSLMTLVACLWKGNSKGLAIASIAISAVGLALGLMTFISVTRPKPTLVEMLQQSEAGRPYGRVTEPSTNAPTP